MEVDFSCSLPGYIHRLIHYDTFREEFSVVPIHKFVLLYVDNSLRNVITSFEQEENLFRLPIRIDSTTCEKKRHQNTHVYGVS